MNKTKSKKALRITLVIITILYIGFIFSNSLKPANASSQDSGKVTELINGFFRIFNPDFELTESVVRTFAHFSEFLILGVFSFITFRMFTGKSYYYLPFSVLLVSATALSDECIQLTSVGRAFEVTDIITDILGALLGILLTFILYLIIKGIKKCKMKRTGKVKGNG